jgi:hypothetical protein
MPPTQPPTKPTMPPQPPTKLPTQPPTKPTMPPQPPTKPPTSLVPGLKEEVWYKKYGMRRLPTSWSSPSFTRGVSKIDYRSTGSPWSGLTERDNFAVRWTGEVKLDAGGRYEWCTRSDDGSKMIIDGSLIVNNDGLHGMRMRCGWKTSGVGYNKFEAQMFERGGGAGMEVYYRGPDTSNRRTKMSASKFFFDGKVPTTTTPPPPTAPPPPPTKLVAGLKEEVWYKKYGMRKLPTSWSSPSFTRGVTKIDYRSTGSTWSGLTERDNFAVRWTGYVKIATTGEYEWCTRSDDGSKMIIDGSLIVNNDGLHGMRTQCSKQGVTGDYHKFEAQMFERGGGAGMEVYYSGPDTSNRRTKISASKFFFDGKVPTTTTPPPPTAPPPPPSYVVAGLKEEVWYKKYGMRKLPTSWSSPSFTRKIAKIDYRSTGRPWSGLKERDNFAVRWTGYVKIATAGEYTWYTTSDDGSKLLIDGQKVVDNDGLHGMRTKSGKGQLLVGYHMFEAQMFERGGGAGMYVYYRGPGMGYRQKVPSSKYFMLGPPTTTTAPPTTTTQDDPISGDDGDMGDGDLN